MRCGLQARPLVTGGGKPKRRGVLPHHTAARAQIRLTEVQVATSAQKIHQPLNTGRGHKDQVMPKHSAPEMEELLPMGSTEWSVPGMGSRRRPCQQWCVCASRTLACAGVDSGALSASGRCG